MKRTLSILIIISLLISLSGCKNGKKRFEAEFLQLFDTVTKIIAYTESKAEFEALSNFVYDTLEQYHRLYDIYHDYDGISNIKTINDNAGKVPVKVDRKIIDLLIFSRQAYDMTDGKCNIALGSVLHIWHQYREDGINDPGNAALPPKSLLEQASRHTDINKIIIDSDTSTVFLEDPDMRIDVGSVAKGYAVERLAQAIIEHGNSFVLFSVGGNVRAVGGRNQTEPWKIGIENPDEKTEGEMPTVRISDKSAVTSGTYQRFYTVDGRQYHHIIDPKSLMPSEYFKSVTVICRDSGLADALSTAVFCMPYERGRQLIDSIEGTDALWIMPDSELKYSDNFKQYTK